MQRANSLIYKLALFPVERHQVRPLDTLDLFEKEKVKVAFDCLWSCFGAHLSANGSLPQSATQRAFELFSFSFVFLQLSRAVVAGPNLLPTKTNQGQFVRATDIFSFDQEVSDNFRPWLVLSRCKAR